MHAVFDGFSNGLPSEGTVTRMGQSQKGGASRRSASDQLGHLARSLVFPGFGSQVKDREVWTTHRILEQRFSASLTP